MARIYGINKWLVENNVDQEIISQIIGGAKPCEFVYELI